MQRLQQAFRERPWLRQRRVWGTLALVVALLGLVTAIDLHLSNQRLIAQRATVNMLSEMSRLETQNAVLRTQIARQASWDRIYRKAQEEGLEEISPQEQDFVLVPGGLQVETPSRSSATEVRDPAQDWLRPEYKESLLDWLLDVLMLNGG